jgi:hypothetical protein
MDTLLFYQYCRLKAIFKTNARSVHNATQPRMIGIQNAINAPITLKLLTNYSFQRKAEEMSA